MNEALARLGVRQDALDEFCRRWRIAEFSFFGSILRVDFRPESDVDVLVTFEEPSTHSAFDVMEIQDELAVLFGHKVDLAERGAIETSRNYIRRENILHARPAGDRDSSYLLDMLIAARDAARFSNGLTRARFETDSLACHASLMMMIRVCSAAARVSLPTRERLATIPWEDIVGLEQAADLSSLHPRLDPVWRVLQKQVPSMIPVLEGALPPEQH